MRVGSRLDLASILTEASALAGRHPFAFALAALAYVTLGTWSELQVETWNETIIQIVAITLVAGLLQYLVLQRILGPAQDRGHIRAIFVPVVAVTLHFLAWLVIGVAYLLLLFPGLYLAGRVSAAVGVAIVEREGLVASLVHSWRRTRAGWWPLLLAHAILLVPLIALIGLGVGLTLLEWGTLDTDETSIEVALLSNAMFGVMTAAGWAVSGAAYRLTAPHDGAIDEIFG